MTVYLRAQDGRVAMLEGADEADACHLAVVVERVCHPCLHRPEGKAPLPDFIDAVQAGRGHGAAACPG